MGQNLAPAVMRVPVAAGCGAIAVHVCLDGDGRSLEEAFGPVVARVNTAGARGEPKPKEVGRGKMVGWFLRTVLKARFNGDYKHTPLFRTDTGAPIAVPRILGAAELAEVMDAVRSK